MNSSSHSTVVFRVSTVLLKGVCTGVFKQMSHSLLFFLFFFCITRCRTRTDKAAAKRPKTHMFAFQHNICSNELDGCQRQEPGKRSAAAFWPEYNLQIWILWGGKKGCYFLLCFDRSRDRTPDENRLLIITADSPDERAVVLKCINAALYWKRAVTDETALLIEWFRGRRRASVMNKPGDFKAPDVLTINNRVHSASDPWGRTMHVLPIQI